MKVQNELKEILRQAFNAGWWYRDSKEIYPNVDDWMEQNQSKILASVEPEPLAKNKDSESICEKCNDHVDYLYDGLCYDCYDDEHGM
mgnify:CR=1 FL=1|tara:strand:+ start:364 stop:624 length:261 start_codon:yes stop_codon:yes gene_type:complete